MGGVAEVEDAPVGGKQPVAIAAGRGRHCDDRPGQRDSARAAEIPRVAIAEDAPVRRRQPISVPAGSGSDGDDRSVEGHVGGTAQVAGVAEVEDAAVRRRQPVARLGRPAGRFYRSAHLAGAGVAGLPGGLRIGT
jgi:hypothetical protein